MPSGPFSFSGVITPVYWVSRVGIEPTTDGLKVRCSAAELPAHQSVANSAGTDGPAHFLCQAAPVADELLVRADLDPDLHPGVFALHHLAPHHDVARGRAQRRGHALLDRPTRLPKQVVRSQVVHEQHGYPASAS